MRAGLRGAPTSRAAFAHGTGCTSLLLLWSVRYHARWPAWCSDFARRVRSWHWVQELTSTLFGRHAQCAVPAGLGAAVSTRHCSPHTCVRVSKTLFLPAALHYSEHCWPWRCRPHAPLLAAQLRACEQEFVLPAALHYFERCWPWRCRPHAPLLAAQLRACEQEFVLPDVLHSFERCWPWRCRPHAPLLAAQLRACEQEFVLPAALRCFERC